MRKYLIAAAAATLFALPLPASATSVSTDVSAQTIVVSPRGGGMHSRFESRDRGDRRRMDRGRRCTTEVTRVERRGRMVTTRRKVCS